MPENDPANPTPTPTPNTTPDPKDEATKERDRLQAENADLRKRQKASDDKAQQALDELAALRKAGNKTSGDWQKVATDLETEVSTLKAANTAMREGFKNTIVSGRLREEALKQGAKADMVDLIDSMEFDEVEFNLDENALKFNLKGVDTAIGNLKKLRPSFFDVKTAPKFNAGGNPSGSGEGTGDVTDVAVAKANYQAALAKRGKDPAAFNKAHLDYQNALKNARKGKQ